MKTVYNGQVYPNFDALPDRLKNDLLAWFNRPMNEDDKEFLCTLFKVCAFTAWDCPECGSRVYYANLGSYENDVRLKGVKQVGLYFDEDANGKFTEEYVRLLCDNCQLTKQTYKDVMIDDWRLA